MSTKQSGAKATGVLPWVVLGGIVLWAGQACAFSLLDYPSHQAVLAGDYKTWAMDPAASPAVPLTYALDPTLSAALCPNAGLAALNALASWDAASCVLTYTDADYAPVENSRTNFISMWIGGGQWEGSAAAFGLGASIDIMARDQDFSIIDYRNELHGFKDSGQTGAGSLAFTLINASNGRINSVDVYLNSDYAWSTSGGHYDVETVVLHELGHAIGLDHPDQAVAMGAENYDPWTFQPGKTATGAEPMHSCYWPDTGPTAFAANSPKTRPGDWPFCIPGSRAT